MMSLHDDNTAPEAGRELHPLARRVVERMAEIGMSRATVASQLGLTYQAVHHWSTGAAIPGSETLPRLANVLGLDLAELAVLRTARRSQAEP